MCFQGLNQTLNTGSSTSFSALRSASSSIRLCGVWSGQRGGTGRLAKRQTKDKLKARKLSCYPGAISEPNKPLLGISFCRLPKDTLVDWSNGVSSSGKMQPLLTKMVLYHGLRPLTERCNSPYTHCLVYRICITDICFSIYLYRLYIHPARHKFAVRKLPPSPVHRLHHFY